MTAEPKANINELIGSNTVENLTIAYYCLVGEGLTKEAALHYIVANYGLLSIVSNDRSIDDLIAIERIIYNQEFIGIAKYIIELIYSVDDIDCVIETHTTVFGHITKIITFSHRIKNEIYNVKVTYNS